MGGKTGIRPPYFIIQNTETKYSEFKTPIRMCDFKFVILNTDNQ